MCWCPSQIILEERTCSMYWKGGCMNRRVILTSLARRNIMPLQRFEHLPPMHVFLSFGLFSLLWKFTIGFGLIDRLQVYWSYNVGVTRRFLLSEVPFRLIPCCIEAHAKFYGFVSWKWPLTLCFFIYNLNQQSDFTFYKLMLWLLQCLDGESSSGESSIPQIMSIGQFLLSSLFSSLKKSFLSSGFSWVSNLVWWLLHFRWMTSCTYDMPRSACSVALETYHGAASIILRILDWLLWIIDILDLLA
jgi:hypothetical protein